MYDTYNTVTVFVCFMILVSDTVRQLQQSTGVLYIYNTRYDGQEDREYALFTLSLIRALRTTFLHRCRTRVSLFCSTQQQQQQQQTPQYAQCVSYYNLLHKIIKTPIYTIIIQIYIPSFRKLMRYFINVNFASRFCDALL